MSKSVSTPDAILNAAQKLIVIGGYHGFSYADIAEIVGIRKASIHHHFPNKSDLVTALLKRYVGQLQSGLTQLKDALPTPADRLKAYITYWRQCIADASNPYCVGVILAGELPSLPANVTEGVREHFSFLSAWLQQTLTEGVETNTISLQASPHAEAETILALVHGAMLSARAYSNPESFALVADQILTRLKI